MFCIRHYLQNGIGSRALGRFSFTFSVHVFLTIFFLRFQLRFLSYSRGSCCICLMNFSKPGIYCSCCIMYHC
ncbi:hypothetical protein M413DRAFT_84042 [Hebeloma cylindrosporum]|uniref:Uncharacterized protein n=1 Tax=Hebeloma cylindrosporum TaxID=76867 RepID=A0A0C2Z698_HEBCY|nr:hypothetical protein M413DRAFT_84042 [Hebeloma cylindrosporum h7]